jgi:dihydrofolate reductase
MATTAIVTEIEANFEGDAYAPTFGPEWTETAREPLASSTGLRFSFVSYSKNSVV